VPPGGSPGAPNNTNSHDFATTRYERLVTNMVGEMLVTRIDASNYYYYYCQYLIHTSWTLHIRTWLTEGRSGFPATNNSRFSKTARITCIDNRFRKPKHEGDSNTSEAQRVAEFSITSMQIAGPQANSSLYGVCICMLFPTSRYPLDIPTLPPSDRVRATTLAVWNNQNLRVVQQRADPTFM